MDAAVPATERIPILPPADVAHFQSALSAAEPVKAASVVPVAPAKVPWLNSQAHITLSGLAMFIFMAIGIIWPQYKPKADELAVAAGTYLFASAKAK
jgi:hypothetical protein